MQITSLTVDPSQQFILSTANDQNIVIWQRSTTAESHVYNRLGAFCLHGNVTSVAMTTDRQRIVVMLKLAPVKRRALLLLRTVNI